MADEKSGTEELRELIRDLGKMPADMRREMRPMLKATATKPLMQARQNAAWSSRIPGATTVTTSFSKKTAGVGLKTSKIKAPHARPFENQGKPGQFRHRVYGQDVWVNETARPFLWKAAVPWFNSVDDEIGEVVDSVSKKYGFR